MKRIAYGLAALLLGAASGWGQKVIDEARGRQAAPVRDAAQMPWFLLGEPPIAPTRPMALVARGGTVSIDALRVPQAAAKEMQKFVKDFTAGNLEDSIKHVSKAIRIYPQWAAAHYNLGQTYARRGEYASAIEEFENAAELDAKMVRPWIGLAKIRLLQNQYAAAETAARRALEIDPVNIDAKYFLGRILVAAGKDTVEATELLEKSKEQFVAARLVLANVYLKRGAVQAATNELQGYVVQPNAPDKTKVQCMVRKLTEPARTVDCSKQ
jgi:tetratricopeptide (TPR) repeat protein